MPSATMPEPGLAFRFRLEVGVDVHAGRVEPAEERRAGPVLPVDEVERAGEELLVHRLHALARERAGVLDGLLADAAEARILGRIVPVARLALQHAARAELGAELGVLRIVGVLRLLLGVEVVEVAEELVEAVDRRQELVAVAEMVLAELAGRVALRLEQLGERRVLLGQPFLGARQADLEKPGAEAGLAGDEGGAPGGAGLLRVMVGEDRAFLGDAVDVRRAVAHHAAVVGADVPQPDVVAEDDEDVRLAAGRGGGPRRRRGLRLRDLSGGSAMSWITDFSRAVSAPSLARGPFNK